jgi:Zn-finger nucleic acid-binding protein
MTRYCPRCEGTKLQERLLEDRLVSKKGGARGEVIVDRCPQCSGLFFDAREAESTLGAEGDLLTLAEAQLQPMVCDKCQKSTPPGKEKCAHCQESLGLVCSGCGARMKLIDVLGVKLDVCPQCQALWFDEGELEKVRRRYEARIDQLPDEDLPSHCLRCGKSDLGPKERVRVKNGFYCKDCMSKRGGSGVVLSSGGADEGDMASAVVETWIWVNVVDAVFDLFGSD